MRRPVTTLILLTGIEVSFFAPVAGGAIFLAGLVAELTAWTGE